MSSCYHPYHLVSPSPWPYLGAVGALLTTTGSVCYFHYSLTFILFLGLLLLVLTFIFWWRDIIRESTFGGYHTQVVRGGLRYGMILLITSEVLFFVAFFWAYFHSSLSPAPVLGSLWPPIGVETLNPFGVPLLNTAILLSSGATLTWAHHALINGERLEAIKALSGTIILGVQFTALQYLEYLWAPFTIGDSAYGSTFFVATGFHGIHVIIGTLFLAVCLSRLIKYHYTRHHHVGFEAASWYWHFVDVVWLFLYLCIYVHGS